MTFIQKWFGPQNVKASPTFNKRWLMVVPAFMTHFCIGSPWAWSLIAGKKEKANNFGLKYELVGKYKRFELYLSLLCKKCCFFLNALLKKVIYDC